MVAIGGGGGMSLGIARGCAAAVTGGGGDSCGKASTFVAAGEGSAATLLPDLAIATPAAIAPTSAHTPSTPPTIASRRPRAGGLAEATSAAEPRVAELGSSARSDAVAEASCTGIVAPCFVAD